MSRQHQTASHRRSAGRHLLAAAAERAKRRRAWPRWTLPTLQVALVVVLLAVAGFGGWQLWASGVGQAAADRVANAIIRSTAVAGFRVDEVLVHGRSGTEKADLLAAIGVQRGDPILGISLTRAQAALERLPWVAGATIERRLPDLVFIRLTEREPMALWQFDRRLVLIDHDGNILADQGVERFAHLPIIVGKGAPQHAPALLTQLAAEPAIGSHVGAAVWVGGRRWDLRLDNGINIRLPENDYAPALHRLCELIAHESLLNRDIVAIDLRLPDRLIVQTSDGVSTRRRVPGEKI